jgi:hypothetical protein
MGNVYFPAVDGQHAHGKLNSGHLEIDDDIRPVVVRHKALHPECFTQTEDWPVSFQTPLQTRSRPYKVSVFCGRCQKVIGQCTVIDFKAKNGKR